MIAFTESSIKVYQTTDYAWFKFIDGNRELNDTKIKRILADIEDGIDVLKYYPIQVRENKSRLEIQDGQHRFYIAKRLKRPVYFILMPEQRSLNDIAKINSNTEKWKTKDFIHCYVQLGNRHYHDLEEFMTVYELSATLSIKLLRHGTPSVGGKGQSGQQDFQRGDFEVRHMDAAVQLTEMCRKFKDFKHWKSTSFFIAIHRIMQAGKVNLEELVEKYEKHKDELLPQSGAKEYISNLEVIFNKSKRERVVII